MRVAGATRTGPKPLTATNRGRSGRAQQTAAEAAAFNKNAAEAAALNKNAAEAALCHQTRRALWRFAERRHRVLTVHPLGDEAHAVADG